MSIETEQTVLQLPVARRLFVLITVVVASASFNAATFSIAAVLPQVQGALSATQDEISWAVTFYILATAVCMPMTGWLVARFGRGSVQFWALAGFTFSTMMCGLAQSLDGLVLWRLVQGATGAPLLPLGQSVLMDVFPRRQHGLVIAIFGTTNTIGPIIGPTFAGYLAEYLSWRWGFFMIVPVAFGATIAARFALPEEPRQRHLSLDWVGFLSLSIAIASTQFVLSRGQRLDWFESTEIIIEVAVAALAFYVFLVHSATAPTPYLSPRLLVDRNYVIGLFLIVIFGMLNFTPMVLLPPLMQNQLGFPDGLIGFVVSWRGAGVMTGSALSIVAQRFDPRVGMVTGFSLQIISGIWLTHLNLNAPLLDLCVNAWLQGSAVGLIWTPIVTTAFRTLDHTLRAEGIAVMHLMRSIGSSFFISVSVTQILRVTSANYSRLVEGVTPYNKTLSLPDAMGGWTTESTSGIAAIAREINRQAAMLGYMNAFVMYTAASVIAIPLVLMLGGRRKSPA
ncbi:MAG: DHA2 family efflux MFS transporter permease subunit [Hyphomicrobiaceae bacterium]|nr:DHA2 family efflux MFS transporter permease subunit [Hyphomicrobiaceae bacterium]